MSAQVTEAHLELAKTVIFSRDSAGRLLTAPMGAQLIADSEARAVAEIAMVAAASADRNVSLRLERDQLRAEVEQWELAFQEQYARAERAGADLATAKAIIASIEEDGTEEHNAAVGLRQELAAERARRDWLGSGFWITGEPCDRAAIDAAMKEETK